MATIHAEILSERVLTLARVRELADSGRAREIRLSSRLSLYDLAGAVGTTASTVQRWENGDRRPLGDPALRYGALLDALARQLDNDRAPHPVVEKEGADAAHDQG
jgi:transcriptional regulator with XRE-family HTH domain